MAGFAVLLFVLLLLALPILMLYGIVRWLYGRWVIADRRRGERVAILCAGALVVSSPYLLFRGGELHADLSRVPPPLQVGWIDYRLEQSWGIGLPGDNETGLVIYRMTRASAEWARQQGSHLGDALSGDTTGWLRTPIDTSDPQRGWHGHDRASPLLGQPARLKDYLGQYGFSIPIEAGRDKEIDDAIQHPGSVYAYGQGGSVTIVDPKRGKIYFAYAG